MISSGISIAPTPYSHSELTRAWSEIQEALPSDCPFLDRHVRQVKPEELATRFYRDSPLLVLISNVAKAFTEFRLSFEGRSHFFKMLEDLKKNLLLRPEGQGRIIIALHTLRLLKKFETTETVPSPTFDPHEISLQVLKCCVLTRKQILQICKALLIDLNENFKQKKYHHVLTARSIQIRLNEEGEFDSTTLSKPLESRNNKLQNSVMAVAILIDLFMRQELDTSLFNEFVNVRNILAFLEKQQPGDFVFFRDNILEGQLDLVKIYKTVEKYLNTPTQTLEVELGYTPFTTFPFIKCNIPKNPLCLIEVFNEANKFFNRSRLHRQFLNEHLGSLYPENEREISGGYVMPTLDHLTHLADLLEIRCVVYQGETVFQEILKNRLDIPIIHIHYDGTYFDLLIPQCNL